MSGSQLTLFLIYIATSLLLDTSAIFLNGLVAYVLESIRKQDLQHSGSSSAYKLLMSWSVQLVSCIIHFG